MKISKFITFKNLKKKEWKEIALNEQKDILVKYIIKKCMENFFNPSSASFA